VITTPGEEGENLKWILLFRRQRFNDILIKFVWLHFGKYFEVRYMIIWLVFITEAECVYWTLRAESLSTVQANNFYHHHKHQGLNPLIRSLSRVTTALASVSSVFQLFSFLVVFSDMISKGFHLVAFFAGVKASFVCIHPSCLVCIQSVVHGVRSRLFCGHNVCSLPEISITSFLPLQFFVSVRLSESNFLTHIKM
jgi:hypothetical protein